MQTWDDNLTNMVMNGLAAEMDEFDMAPDPLVFGADDRRQVSARGTPQSTLRFPFNTICFIERGAPLRRCCTGTVIAPRVVLMAAHSLRVGKTIRVTPAADLTAKVAAEQRPFGSQVIAPASFRTHPTLDIGVAILPAPFPHKRFMLLQPRTAQNSLADVTIAGYSGGKPTGTLWGHTGRITRVTPTSLEYTIDTKGGQSGSPVWLAGNDDWQVLLGVHVTGSATTNAATRITCDVIDWIRAQCKAAGVAGPWVDKAYDAQCSGGRRLSDSAP